MEAESALSIIIGLHGGVGGRTLHVPFQKGYFQEIQWWRLSRKGSNAEWAGFRDGHLARATIFPGLRVQNPFLDRDLLSMDRDCCRFTTLSSNRFEICVSCRMKTHQTKVMVQNTRKVQARQDPFLESLSCHCRNPFILSASLGFINRP